MLVKGKMSAGRSSAAWAAGDLAAKGWGMVLNNRPAGAVDQRRRQKGLALWGVTARPGELRRGELHPIHPVRGVLCKYCARQCMTGYVHL